MKTVFGHYAIWKGELVSFDIDEDINIREYFLNFEAQFKTQTKARTEEA